MTEKDKQIALSLHEFSVRYREEWKRRNATPQASMDVVKGAVRDQYAQEQKTQREAQHSPAPQQEKTQQRDGPEMGE